MLDSEHLSCDQNVAEILASANPTSLWVKGSTCSSELVVRNWFAASNIHVLWITFESAVCDLACTVLWEGDSVMGLSTRLQTSTFFLQFLISSDEGLPLVFPHIFRWEVFSLKFPLYIFQYFIHIYGFFGSFESILTKKVDMLPSYRWYFF